MPGAVTFVLNDKCDARHVEDARAMIARLAAEHGRPVKTFLAGKRGDLESFAKQAREERAIVVAGGGDGTVSTVAAALVGSDVPLGVLPMGTLNHFAKDLHIPLDLEAAIRTVFTGTVSHVDVGEVNGHFFLNNSSIGLYPHIVREREEHQRHGYGKWLAFARAVVQVLTRRMTMHVELANADGTTLARDTPMLFVGNNRYEAVGRAIGTRRKLDEGTLWVCAAPPSGILKLLGLAVAALTGRAGAADLTVFDTKELRVRTRRGHVEVATDGEVNTMRAPLHYRIHPSALRVLVPAAR